jgi:glucokinase
MGAADKTDRKLIFAADLGGTHLRAATVDQKGHIHSRFKQNTPQVKDASTIVDAIVAAVDEFQKAAEISAVSLVVPGTVNVGEGSVVKAPNLPCLDGFR